MPFRWVVSRSDVHRCSHPFHSPYSSIESMMLFTLVPSFWIKSCPSEGLAGDIGLAQMPLLCPVRDVATTTTRISSTLRNGESGPILSSWAICKILWFGSFDPQSISALEEPILWLGIEDAHQICIDMMGFTRLLMSERPRVRLRHRFYLQQHELYCH